MNRYSPHYNYDENRTEMTIDDDGSWVHISKTKDLLRERDEARAEVERLRVAIARFVAQYPWQDGPEIQELKALKEG